MFYHAVIKHIPQKKIIKFLLKFLVTHTHTHTHTTLPSSKPFSPADCANYPICTGAKLCVLTDTSHSPIPKDFVVSTADKRRQGCLGILNTNIVCVVDSPCDDALIIATYIRSFPHRYILEINNER